MFVDCSGSFASGRCAGGGRGGGGDVVVGPWRGAYHSCGCGVGGGGVGGGGGGVVLFRVCVCAERRRSNMF